MICSKEEFLLLLQKWMSSSQRVVVTLSFGSLPLSRLATVRISGLILNVRDGEKEQRKTKRSLEIVSQFQPSLAVPLRFSTPYPAKAHSQWSLRQ